VPDYKNGKQGTPESHARNDECQPSKNAGRNEITQEKTYANQVRLQAIQDKIKTN
jgi:hypothetical protein